MAKPKRCVLNAETIGKLADGLVGKILDNELRAIHDDMHDRGHDQKPRTLTLKITFTPDANGVVDVKANVTKKLPDMVPPRTVAKTSPAFNGIIFHPDNADNPDQMVLTDEDQTPYDRAAAE